MSKEPTVYQGRAVYLVDGSRTPFLKARGKPGPFSSSDLAVSTCESLLLRQPFSPTAFNEVIGGATSPSADEANIGRVIALRLGCGDHMPAWTVQRNCGTGMQAIDSAAKDICTGRHDLVLAGGVDAMSRAPLLFNHKMVVWLANWNQAKNVVQKLKVLSQLRPQYFAPIIALLHGLTDPVVGMSMGQTAENLAYLFGISRLEMDEYAVRSQQRLARAQKENLLPEITTLYDKQGNFYQYDDGVRPDSSLEKLAKLKPVFDKFGSVTAGNSSQITDGAAFVILASKSAVKRYKLPVIARLVDVEWAAISPTIMGLGPVYAATPLMLRHHLSMPDIDYWEINEAFAAQVIACIRAWDDADYCRQHLGLKDKLGRIDPARLNIYGGAIGMGHPVGASGARIVIQLANILRQTNSKRGIATECIGGGQGGAMLLENVAEVSSEDDE